MAEVINMPRLSDTMEEGTVAKWLKKVGDKIEEGDILAEIETDKATMEFESFYEGTLLHVGLKEGEGAPVDTLLAIIGKEGENIDDLISGNGTSSSESKDKDDKTDEAEDKVNQEDDKQSSNEEVEANEDSNKSNSDDKEKNGDSDAGTGDAEMAKTSKSEENDSKGSAATEDVDIIKMPRLSDTMEEGTVASWLKNVGDKVEEGDILAEIETDKATMEFESFYSGTLLYIGIKEGESAPVDQVLAIIGPEGTDVTAIVKDTTSTSKEEETPTTSTPKDSEQESKQDSEKDKDSKEVEKKESATHDRDRIFVSPLARKMAEEKGISLENVQGSGDNGRIVKKDIEQFKPSSEKTPSESKIEAVASSPATQIKLPKGEEGSEERKNSQMRKVIAKRLGESKFTAPHYYLTIEVNMDSAIASRKQINELPETKVSFNDMVVKACALALIKHPQVNTTWKGETTLYNHHIHMGVAVAVEEGLVVPVLKFADQMSLTQIGGAVKDLAGRARNKKLTPEEMEGSTFTVSNLGMFGIVDFTSIINQPNSAILSVGAIVEKPIVKDGEIVPGNTMIVTLACDHRTVDGATGAQFLQTLKTYLEYPVTMLA